MSNRMAILLCMALAGSALAEGLRLPERAPDAPGRAELGKRLAGLSLAAREREVVTQFFAGNVPSFARRFAEVPVSRRIDGREVNGVVSVAPEYLALGGDEDFLLVPLSPGTAQEIADRLDCVLPTPRMVDAIYAAAAVKLKPAPIPPSSAMTTMPVFLEHDSMVRTQRAGFLAARPPGALVAGHKKDVVVTPRLGTAPGRVAIYGWHTAKGQPIQPLYLGHTESWVDYSHGVRLVRRAMTVGGRATTVDAVLADRALSALLSDEGAFAPPRHAATVTNLPTGPEALAVSVTTNGFGEREETIQFEPGVRVVINSPAALPTNRPLRLVLYALPNGNTVEQTVGRRMKPGGDWRFNIQHIGAQTRWLRDREPDPTLVVAYLECTGLSWPTWCRKNDPAGELVSGMVWSLRSRFLTWRPRLVLTGHSGGGAFTFSYLNSVARVPDDIERVAFLDSNYAYDPARGHDRKLAQWLRASTNHFLCVLAYHDSIALLDGKPFVGEQGGTWGRSQLMLTNMGGQFAFTAEKDATWQRHTALNGRIKFILHENPARTILHTRQVDRNGFIHAMRTGTGREGREYEYFGERVYDRWVAGE
jgi:hypothetical protein